MKLRNLLLNFTVGTAALFFGLAWVGVYQIFLGGEARFENRPATNLNAPADFDINDPQATLPIDFEEDKLSNPHEGENNPELFDPEGSYFLSESSADDFEEFYYFDIRNKNFDVSPEDKRYGELLPPYGEILVKSEDETISIPFQSISISNGKLYFESKTVKGISYEFSGDFLVKGNFYTLDENAKVLKGNLVKKINGDPVKSKRVSLSWTIEDGC